MTYVIKRVLKIYFNAGIESANILMGKFFKELGSIKIPAHNIFKNAGNETTKLPNYQSNLLSLCFCIQHHSLRVYGVHGVAWRRLMI
jgi:hypothetical protein